MTLVTRPSDRQGMAFPASIDPRDRLHVCSSQAALGSFEISTDDPEFATAGPIGSQPVLAFPREPVRIYYEGRNPFISDPTVVNLYNPWQTYRREPIGPPRYASDWIEIEPTLLFEARPELGESLESPFDRSHLRVEPEVFVMLRVLVRAIELDQADRLAVEETVLALVRRVFEHWPGQAREPQMPTERSGWDRIQAVRELLAAEPGGPHTVSSIAGKVHCSPFYLCKEFRRWTGTTLHCYLTELRLRCSLEQVAEPASDLAAIAHDLGFADHSHFTARFHRLFGMPPSRFRKLANRHSLATLARSGPPITTSYS